jgi:predicted dehydrogenase
MTGSRRLRAAIVGAGLMGRWHADAVSRTGGIVAAVVDAAPGRADALARRYRARPASSLTAILDTVDVVHVCTPTASHDALVSEALDAARHVLVEKPLASTAAATRALLTQAATRGVLLCPVHQFPWQPGTQQLVAVLPRLGAIRHMDFVTCSAGATVFGASPDAVALEILPHPLSLLATLVPGALDANWDARHPAAGEWRFWASTGATTVSLLISMGGRPTSNGLRLIATNGTAYLNLFHGFAVIEPGEVSRARKITQPFALATATGLAAAANLARRVVRREPAYPGLRTLVEAFYHAAASGGPPPVAADESLHISIAIDAMRAAVPDAASPPGPTPQAGP